MKILALERDVEGVKWEGMEDILEQEAKHVFQLYLSDKLREIYFTENRNAILILEAAGIEAAKELLDGLPLVKNRKIRFDIMELRPYTGLERIIKK